MAYTTPKLGNDIELLGPASVDLWLKSTATDTNLQATITEVRPDGQEVYVARGWLKASQRKLDQRASTHHAGADAPRVRRRATRAGRTEAVRVEVFAFDYVFRAGSRIRLVIDTPSQTGGWNFEPLPNGGVNSILHDSKHPSSIAVGTVPGSPRRRRATRRATRSSTNRAARTHSPTPAPRAN